MDTDVSGKVIRYQKYLEKCMNDDKVNEKHVRFLLMFYVLIHAFDLTDPIMEPTL